MITGDENGLHLQLQWGWVASLTEPLILELFMMVATWSSTKSPKFGNYMYLYAHLCPLLTTGPDDEPLPLPNVNGPILRKVSL